MSSHDVDFWLDKESSVKESELTSDTDGSEENSPTNVRMDIRAPPTKTLSIPTAASETKPKKVVSEDSNDDIEDEASKEYSKVKDSLMKEIEQLKAMADEDQTVTTDYKGRKEKIIPGSLQLSFICDEKHFNKSLVLLPNEPFTSLLEKLPEEYNGSQLLVEDIKWRWGEIPRDFLTDLDEVKILTGTEAQSTDGLKKLAFSISGGTKRKIALDPSITFAEVAEKLGLKAARFSFDGDTLNLKKRIQDYEDINDGDQIDVFTS